MTSQEESLGLVEEIRDLWEESWGGGDGGRGFEWKDKEKGRGRGRRNREREDERGRREGKKSRERRLLPLISAPSWDWAVEKGCPWRCGEGSDLCPCIAACSSESWEQLHSQEIAGHKLALDIKGENWVEGKGGGETALAQQGL